MALPSRQPYARLIDRLAHRPQQFEFFQAVHLAEEITRLVAGEAGQSVPAGVGTLEAIEPPEIWLHSSMSPGFPGGAIVRARFRPPALPAADARAGWGNAMFDFELAISGLLGPTGVLPKHYSALVFRRWQHHRDLTFLHFCDIFTHRNASLLYRAWWKYRPSIQQERLGVRGIGTSWDHGHDGKRSPVTTVVANLVGLGTSGLGNRLAVDDAIVFRYAGLFASFPRSALALEQMLGDFCRTAVVVEQFIGQWLRLEPPDQTRLAFHAAPEGCNARLGVEAILGARVWDVTSKIEIRVGPIEFDEFLEFLPGRQRLGAVGALARLYVGQRLNIVIRPVLAPEAVPMTRLGGASCTADGVPCGSRLGWTSWLRNQPSATERSDAAFEVD